MARRCSEFLDSLLMQREKPQRRLTWLVPTKREKPFLLAPFGLIAAARHG
jgi:hypothetical protein